MLGQVGGKPQDPLVGGRPRAPPRRQRSALSSTRAGQRNSLRRRQLPFLPHCSRCGALEPLARIREPSSRREARSMTVERSAEADCSDSFIGPSSGPLLRRVGSLIGKSALGLISKKPAMAGTGRVPTIAVCSKGSTVGDDYRCSSTAFPCGVARAAASHSFARRSNSCSGTTPLFATSCSSAASQCS